MKRMLVLFLAVALMLGAAACGGASKAPAPTVSNAASNNGYLNDGDNDPSSDLDTDNLQGHTVDEDQDPAQDRFHPENNRYHDADDSRVNSGREASSADRQAVTAVVRRYYAAVAAEDGIRACAAITPNLARAIPEDYAQAPGPAYLRGAKTCPAVMSLAFKHSHPPMTGAFELTDVRIEGNHALALIGSRTIPASELSLERHNGAWGIDGLFATPLS